MHISKKNIIGLAIQCLVIVVICSTAVFANTPALALESRSQFWFAPLNLAKNPKGFTVGVKDYFALFDSASLWPVSASHVQVFQVFPELVRSSTDHQLTEVISGAHRLHMDIAIELPILDGKSSCQGVAPGGMQSLHLVAKLQTLGADLKYVAMVGPWADSTTGARPGYCKRSISEVARNVAAAAKQIRGVCPKCAIGEVEPLGEGPRFPRWEDLSTYLKEFENAGGAPLDFLHLDVTWEGSWEQRLSLVASQAKSSSVPLGVIYGSDGRDLSDEAFRDSTVRHAHEVEDVLGERPETVIFESWQAFPQRALPEREPTSWTGIIKAYFRPRSELVEEGQYVKLRALVTGQPIPSAPVDFFSPSQREATGTTSYQALVPSNASSVVVGMRVHTQCKCVVQDASLYVQSLSLSADGNTLGPVDLSGHIFSGQAGRALEINVPSNQSMARNSQPIPVEPGSTVKLTVEYHASLASERTGYFALIFKDDRGQEAVRTMSYFKATRTLVKKATTDKNGRIFVGNLAESDPVEVRFEGNEEMQPSVLQIER